MSVQTSIGLSLEYLEKPCYSFGFIPCRPRWLSEWSPAEEFTENISNRNEFCTLRKKKSCVLVGIRGVYDPRTKYSTEGVGIQYRSKLRYTRYAPKALILNPFHCVRTSDRGVAVATLSDDIVWIWKEISLQSGRRTTLPTEASYYLSRFPSFDFFINHSVTTFFLFFSFPFYRHTKLVNWCLIECLL